MTGTGTVRQGSTEPTGASSVPSWRRRPRGLRLGRRAGAIAVVAVAHLTVGLLDAGATAAVRGRPAARRRFARRVARMVTRLGPTFVKAAQVLGTRRDVVPRELCDELTMLQDSVPPLTADQSRAALRDAYDGADDAVFASVEYEPVASGSIACVHRATLHDGTVVAVKLRRPGIDSLMAADLDLLRRGARVVARLPFFRGVPVNEVVGSLCESVLGQLDFVREAADLERLRVELRGIARARVPRPLPEASRPTCIVMEFIPGLELGTSDRCSPATRQAFAVATLDIVYQMLFVNGFVHCDLHPGNLYFTDGGRVVVLDAGFSAQLSPKMRRLFAEFFLNMAIGRGQRCARIVLESAVGLADGADIDGFTTAVADLVARNSGAPAREFSLIAFAGELFDLQRRHGVAASPELVFPLLALLVIEGTVRSLDNGIDFQEAAKPTLNRALFGAP